MNSNCTLCDEFEADATLVDELTVGRLEWLDADWALAPSLGPVSPLHLLLLPRKHCTLALADAGALSLVKALADALVAHAPPERDTLLFEHANSPTGCGIVHAHVHAVTVPRGFDPAPVFGSASAVRLDSLSALAGETRELSWCRDGGGLVHAVVDARISSQTARRAVAVANRVEFDADWRAYSHRPWFESSRAVARDVAAVLRRSAWPARPAA